MARGMILVLLLLCSTVVVVGILVKYKLEQRRGFAME